MNFNKFISSHSTANMKLMLLNFIDFSFCFICPTAIFHFEHFANANIYRTNKHKSCISFSLPSNILSD